MDQWWNLNSLRQNKQNQEQCILIKHSTQTCGETDFVSSPGIIKSVEQHRTVKEQRPHLPRVTWPSWSLTGAHFHHGHLIHPQDKAAWALHSSQVTGMQLVRNLWSALSPSQLGNGFPQVPWPPHLATRSTRSSCCPASTVVTSSSQSLFSLTGASPAQFLILRRGLGSLPFCVEAAKPIPSC